MSGVGAKAGSRRDPAKTRSSLVAAQWGLRGLLLLWAGFWTWFIVMVLASEGWGGWPHGLMIAVPIWGASVAGMLAPRFGGVLLLVAGVVAFWYFPHPGARTLLAAPALALGVAAIALGCWRKRKAAPMMT